MNMSDAKALLSETLDKIFAVEAAPTAVQPYVPPTSAPTVSSSGGAVPLTDAQRGFLAAAHDVPAQPAPVAEPAKPVVHGVGTIVSYDGHWALVCSVVTEVEDNVRSSDGSTFVRSGSMVPLAKPRYGLFLLEPVIGPVEIG